MTGLAARNRSLRQPSRRPDSPRPKASALALTLRCAIHAGAWFALAACAQQAPPVAPPQLVTAAAPVAAASTPVNSSLDAPLFYQLLIGEIELRSGRPGNAFEVMLDAAKRQSDDALYQRAVDIALQARAGEQALSAARAWRSAKPGSVAPARYESQILIALNRPDELAEPLAVWLDAAPTMERPGLLANLPRLMQRLTDPQRQRALIEQLVQPYRDHPDTRDAAMLAQGRSHIVAGDPAAALSLVRSAQAKDPGASAPVLLALELIPTEPAAERIVTDFLGRADPDPALRLAYVRLLTQSQRYAEATSQLESLTRQRPRLAAPWLTLGALRLELHQPREAEQAVQRFLELGSGGETVAADAADDDDTKDAPGEPAVDGDRTQASLLLAQAAEMRGDLQSAEQWLNRIDNPQRALEVQARRASLMARQGRLPEARALIRAVPEHNPGDARAKLMAETQLLRQAKLWGAASELLATASERFPDDVDLIYEQAMIDEKLERFDDMERRLRRVIVLKPDHPHAHNALGYSLADRNQRLPEARELVQQALKLAPGDPFITDSLGWIEFRLGNFAEALRLLRQAYGARPDTEIAAHLGEVLWAAGQQDEARRVWSDARGRDAGNEVLQETLARLKVGL